jgi:predicted ATPase
VLIMLDSCEQIIESIARIAERLLALAPELHILAASREPLRAQGESVLRLMPLALPPPAAILTVPQTLAFPAVNLFVQRATESRETFEVPAADVPIVVDICRQLDGLPLAIELAAAHVNLLGVRALASHPSDRLLRLTRDHRAVIPRHRSLQATLDWSHETLSPVEQAALRRLAIFDGGFDIESAVAVLAGDDIQAADVLEIVISLAAKSLLGSRLIDDMAFFHLLQTSRAYALEKLTASGERKGVEQRHARWQQRRRADLA